MHHRYLAFIYIMTLVIQGTVEVATATYIVVKDRYGGLVTLHFDAAPQWNSLLFQGDCVRVIYETDRTLHRVIRGISDCERL